MVSGFGINFVLFLFPSHPLHVTWVISFQDTSWLFIKDFISPQCLRIHLINFFHIWQILVLPVSETPPGPLRTIGPQVFLTDTSQKAQRHSSNLNCHKVQCVLLMEIPGEIVKRRPLSSIKNSKAAIVHPRWLWTYVTVTWASQTRRGSKPVVLKSADGLTLQSRKCQAHAGTSLSSKLKFIVRVISFQL